MNFIQKLTPVNHSTGRYLNGVAQSVKHIVIHTMAGYMQPSEDRFFNATLQVSAHYGIGMDGELRQWVNESDTAWHAGDWPMNTQSIGIEHEDHGDFNGVRTDELYDTSARLVADICRRYNLSLDRNTIRLHKEVDTMPGGTACPDALDVDRIIAQAQAVLGAKINNTTPDAPAHTDFAVTPIDETVQVTIPVLDVRTGPGLSYQGRQANSPDGYAHQTADVHVIGYIAGDDPYNDGRNIWLKTLNGLGQSHYIWAGGTSFVVPSSEVASPPTVPSPAAPEVPAEPTPAPAPTPESTPTPDPAPSAPATPPVVEPLQESTVQAPVVTKIDPIVEVQLPQAAVVTDLITGQDVEIVPYINPNTGEPTTLTVAGLTTHHGITYLVTQNMLDEHLPHGINQIFINPPTAKKVDSLSKAPVNAPTDDIPAEIGRGWRGLLKFLHIIH